MGLRDVVRILRRGAAFAILATLAAGGTAYYMASTADPTYAARVGVVASQPSAQYGEFSIIAPATVDPGVYQSAILEGDIVPTVLAQLRGAQPSQRAVETFLQSVRIRVENTQRSSTIWIEVRDTSPVFAADAANLIAEGLIAWDRDRARRSIDRGLTAIERAIRELQAEIATANAAGDAERAARLQGVLQQRTAEYERAIDATSNALVIGLLEPLRLATPSERPVGPRVLMLTFLASVLGLLTGYGLQLVRWTLDTRPGNREAVVAATGLPVLAEFTRLGRRARRLSPEAGSALRTNVTIATRHAERQVIVVSCPADEREKAGVAVSLAESYARSGKRALLVDADLRHTAATEWLDVVPSHAAPFEVYLANPERRFLPVSVAVGSKRSFDFVPSFTSAQFPVDLLNEGLAHQLAVWASEYEVIILDGTPVLPYADTLAIAPHSAGVVLCVNATRSDRDQLTEAIGLLNDAQAMVLGVVLTNARPRRTKHRRGDEATLQQQVVDPYSTRVPPTRAAVGSAEAEQEQVAERARRMMKR